MKMALTAHKLPSIAVRSPPSRPSAEESLPPSLFIFFAECHRYPYCAYGEVIFAPFVLQLPFDWPILIEKFCILMEFFNSNFRCAYGFMSAVDKVKVNSAKMLMNLDKTVVKFKGQKLVKRKKRKLIVEISLLMVISPFNNLRTYTNEHSIYLVVKYLIGITNQLYSL